MTQKKNYTAFLVYYSIEGDGPGKTRASLFYQNFPEGEKVVFNEEAFIEDRVIYHSELQWTGEQIAVISAKEIVTKESFGRRLKNFFSKIYRQATGSA